MCIIVAKEKNVKLPSIDILERCFQRNPDGAGYMYTNNGKVIIDKGYMTWKSFKKHYYKLCEKYNDFENKSLVIHFRIGTDGSNTPKNTHPYSIVNSYNEMQKQYQQTDLGLMHNGIITHYRPEKEDGDIVDTMKFIKEFLTPIKQGIKDFYKSTNLMSAINYLTNSRICILDANDNIYYSGDFVTDNGIKYSNTNYKDYSNIYKKHYSYYEDYYDDGYDYKTWHYTYTKPTKTEPKTETLDLEKYLTKVNIGDNILTESGRNIKVNKDYYYYDKTTETLYMKTDFNEYKKMFSNCTIWSDKGEN